jgi:coproporphyrinogen III oxidase
MARKTKEEIAEIYQQMQNHICEGIAAADGKGFY